MKAGLEMPSITSILIVEDDQPTAELYQTLLEKAGYNILTAPDTQTASRLLEGIEVELILLDYELPDQNGADWLRELRQQRVYERTPVVLVSQINRDVDLTGDHFVFFMEKPRNAQHIVNTVQQTIAQIGVKR